MIMVEIVVVAVLFGAVWFLTSRRTKGRAGELMVGLVSKEGQR